MIELKIKAVSKSFSGVQALSDISLSLPEGMIRGLIGPNGSGKTTLLNVISGIYPPDRGEIWLGARNITGMRPDRIARLGITRTFQNARLFQNLNVIENIQTTVSAHEPRHVDAQTAGLLERLELTRWRNARAGSLPYGIQRRLEIARALGAHPKFLLLDEPAAGLNEVESAALMEIIRNIRNDTEYGCGILIIDHDLRLIMRLCDQIHVLNEGRAIGEGKPEAIRRHPAVIEAYLGEQLPE